ncbi:MATE family efflux transporter [Methylophaga sp. OBS4]|uniref:MATE family efflux transporter n=1 Tax=Methylophaga sp. OBS4 TaxID=2991935 RepID=UPI00224CFA4E|nr:MATE family efflux transporter [Methylophaga sp. OBS4]MCX4187834.1 MATE family efflux transporter [Methylophaga sp. OBS4]
MQNENANISHKKVWAIAGPMILANLSTPLLGMVDTAVVGHLQSPIYLGAVALGTVLFSFLFWGFGFLRMVTTGLTSQANGKQAEKELHAVLVQSGLLALIIAALLLLLQSPIAWLAFKLIDGSPQVLEQAQIYYQIRIWSAPATLVNYVILGWLIGQEASRSALLMVLVINLSNIVFDLLLVNQFGMKADGVALASVIAEYTGLLLALFLLKKRHIHLAGIKLLAELKLLLINRQDLNLHGNFMLRTLCLIFSFAFFTNQGAQQGDITLAANMVLLNFITFMAYVLDGFANATEVMSGKAIGRNDKAQLKRSLLLNGFWSVLVALLFSLSYYLLGDAIISLLTSIEEVAAQAAIYLPWVMLAPVIGVWSYLFDGLFVGATLGREMRNTMLFSTFCCYLPAWYLLQPWGNHGLWAALIILLAARGLSQSVYLPRIMRESV